MKKYLKFILGVSSILYMFYFWILFYNYHNNGTFLITGLIDILAIATFSISIYYPISLLKKYAKLNEESYDFSFALLSNIYFPILILFANYLVIVIGFTFLVINFFFLSKEKLNFKFLTIKNVRFLNITFLIALIIYFFGNIFFYFYKIKYLNEVKEVTIECNKKIINKYKNLKEIKGFNNIYNDIYPYHKDVRKENSENCELLIISNNREPIKARITHVSVKQRNSKMLNQYFIEFYNMPGYYFASKKLYEYVNQRDKVKNEDK